MSTVRSGSGQPGGDTGPVRGLVHGLKEEDQNDPTSHGCCSRPRCPARRRRLDARRQRLHHGQAAVREQRAADVQVDALDDEGAGPDDYQASLRSCFSDPGSGCVQQCFSTETACQVAYLRQKPGPKTLKDTCSTTIDPNDGVASCVEQCDVDQAKCCLKTATAATPGCSINPTGNFDADAAAQLALRRDRAARPLHLRAGLRRQRTSRHSTAAHHVQRLPRELRLIGRARAV